MSVEQPLKLDLTTAMARLLSDRELRAQFRNDAGQVAVTLGIDESARETFVGLNPAELEEQAQGLIEKRKHEVARLLPLTWKPLSLRADPLFQEFAESFWPEGHRRHLLDAVRFGEYLGIHCERSLNTVEWNQRRFDLVGRSLSFHFVKDLIIEDQTRYAIQILIRWRGRIIQRFLF